MMFFWSSKLELRENEISVECVSVSEVEEISASARGKQIEGERDERQLIDCVLGN